MEESSQLPTVPSQGAIPQPCTSSTVPKRARSVSPFQSVHRAEEDAAPNAPAKRRLRFEERYDRITLYLEKPVHLKLRGLYDTGEIQNMSEFLNGAVRNALKAQFPKD